MYMHILFQSGQSVEVIARGLHQTDNFVSLKCPHHFPVALLFVGIFQSIHRL